MENLTLSWLRANPAINWRGADGFRALICGKSCGKWKFCAASGITARSQLVYAEKNTTLSKNISRNRLYELGTKVLEYASV